MLEAADSASVFSKTKEPYVKLEAESRIVHSILAVSFGHIESQIWVEGFQKRKWGKAVVDTQLSDLWGDQPILIKCYPGLDPVYQPRPDLYGSPASGSMRESECALFIVLICLILQFIAQILANHPEWRRTQ